METNIIRIGNSHGVILPSGILRQLNLNAKSSVDVLIEDNKIIIRSSPRQGWEAAAQKMAAAGDDTPLMPDFFEDEDVSWWTWNEKK
jgi:antitoxin MazE